jgi:hypothetical protein
MASTRRFKQSGWRIAYGPKVSIWSSLSNIFASIFLTKNPIRLFGNSQKHRVRKIKLRVHPRWRHNAPVKNGSIPDAFVKASTFAKRRTGWRTGWGGEQIALQGGGGKANHHEADLVLEQRAKQPDFTFGEWQWRGHGLNFFGAVQAAVAPAESACGGHCRDPRKDGRP